MRAPFFFTYEAEISGLAEKMRSELDGCGQEISGKLRAIKLN